MKKIISDFLVIVGLITIVIGATMIFAPAGIIVGGIFALLLGWCAYRSDHGEGGDRP